MEELQIPYMDEFAKYLEDEDKLAKKTVKRHVLNATDFIYYMSTHGYEIDCDYEEDEIPVNENLLIRGPEYLQNYFGYFLPVKAFATAGSLRESGGSVKKLYKFLAKKGLVSEQVRDDILAEIKEGMPFWLEGCD